MITSLWVVGLLVAVNIAISIAFLVAWARNFAETVQFTRTGLPIIALFAGAEIVMFGLVGQEMVDKSPLTIIAVNAITAVRIYAFTVVGLLLAQRLNDHYSRFMRPVSDVRVRTSYGISAPTGKTLAVAVLATVFMIVASVILFVITKPAIGAAFRTPEDLSTEVSLTAVFAVSAVAFAEEIIFRLGLQNGLTYLWRWSEHGHHWAVLATSTLWTAAYIGSLDPNWVKMVQVFIFGLILGQMNRKLGVIPCIVTHVLFNATMFFVSSELVRQGVISIGPTP